jgi:hypothetical protein
MTDPLREAITNGERARALLEDAVLWDAFDTLKNKYTDAWRTSAPEQSADRERVYYALQGLEMVKRALRVILDNGKVAATILERREKNDATS